MASFLLCLPLSKLWVERRRMPSFTVYMYVLSGFYFLHCLHLISSFGFEFLNCFIVDGRMGLGTRWKEALLLLGMWGMFYTIPTSRSWMICDFKDLLVENTMRSGFAELPISMFFFHFLPHLKLENFLYIIICQSFNIKEFQISGWYANSVSEVSTLVLKNTIKPLFGVLTSASKAS